MRFIYLENFRGFEKTTIPITPVTFCVGENSTGKTSLLNLIEVISSSRFWFDRGFEGDNAGFHGFSDVVSKSSKDKSYFRFGYAEFVREPASKEDAAEEARFYLFTYENKDGAPSLKTISISYRGRAAHLHLTEKTIRVKFEKSTVDTSRLNLVSNLFSQWSEIHNDKSTSGYHVLMQKDLNFPIKSVPLMFLGTAVQAILNKAESLPIDQGTSDDSRIVHSIPSADIMSKLIWIAPIRSKPRRTYDEIKKEFSPEGEHTPYVLKKLLSSRKQAIKFKNFLGRFGKSSGLFDEVMVHKFGRNEGAPFELEIRLDKTEININNVGYGVSQALPILVEVFHRRPGSVFAIQQPEVHLHPRAQAEIGELIFEFALRDQKDFIVETHSDYTLDRYRMALSQADEGSQVDSQILFFSRYRGFNKVTPIKITKDGKLDENQPKKYRDFFIKENLSLLEFM